MIRLHTTRAGEDRAACGAKIRTRDPGWRPLSCRKCLVALIEEHNAACAEIRDMADRLDIIRNAATPGSLA